MYHVCMCRTTLGLSPASTHSRLQISPRELHVLPQGSRQDCCCFALILAVGVPRNKNKMPASLFYYTKIKRPSIWVKARPKYARSISFEVNMSEEDKAVSPLPCTRSCLHEKHHIPHPCCPAFGEPAAALPLLSGNPFELP